MLASFVRQLNGRVGVWLKISAALAGTTLLPCMAFASPFAVPDMGAADTFSVKVIADLSRTDGTNEWTIPSFDLTAPLAPDVEAAIAFGRSHVHANEATGFSGWSDVELAIKWELISVPEQGGFGLTVQPVLVIPTGDRQVSDGDFRVEMPVVLGWRAGPFILHAMAGYSASLSTKGDAIPFGTLATYEVNARLTVGVELVGNAAVNNLSRYDAIANVGASYAVAESWFIEARLGRTIRNADDDEVTNFILGIEKTF